MESNDNIGNTPLHYAACCNNTKAVIILLKNGALKALKNHEGLTAIAVAARCGNIGTFKVLLKGNNRLLDPNIVR